MGGRRRCGCGRFEGGAWGRPAWCRSLAGLVVVVVSAASSGVLSIVRSADAPPFVPRRPYQRRERATTIKSHPPQVRRESGRTTCRGSAVSFMSRVSALSQCYSWRLSPRPRSRPSPPRRPLEEKTGQAGRPGDRGRCQTRGRFAAFPVRRRRDRLAPGTRTMSKPYQVRFWSYVQFRSEINLLRCISLSVS